MPCTTFFRLKCKLGRFVNTSPNLRLICIYIISSTVCSSFSGIEFYLAPTTPRSTPGWFSGSQESITCLIQRQVQDQQARLLPLPGYICDHTHLDPDGIHFLPTPGQHYCMHLIDTARYWCLSILHFHC
jgi:hypothetical protein